MLDLTNELKAKLNAAKSIEEVTEIIRADGQEAKEEEVARIWGEITRHREEAGKELSLDELETVSGGYDRNWPYDGCAATVEPDSWCGSNDACEIWDVVYVNPPIDNIGIWDVGNCPQCGGYLSFLQWKDAARHVAEVRCPKCGHTHTVDMHLF